MDVQQTPRCCHGQHARLERCSHTRIGEIHRYPARELGNQIQLDARTSVLASESSSVSFVKNMPSNNKVTQILGWKAQSLDPRVR